MALLSVGGLTAGYGRIIVLRDVSLSIEAGTINLVLGPNGAGKTTLLRAITGLCDVTAGTIELDSRSVRGIRAHKLPRLGVGHVAEGRQLFKDMNVMENLDLGAQGREARGRRRVSRAMVFDLFPVLRQRSGQRAGTLSGGEQQMLAIGRALMSNPRLLLLDEPSTGLAPVVMASVLVALESVAKTGTGILMVEQIVPPVLPAAGTAYVLRDGKIVRQAAASKVGELTDELAASYLR